MTVKEIDGRWHTVNKAGKVGKKRFRSQEAAEAASARGKALLAGTVSETSSDVIESPDTAEERKALGIPAKAEPRGEF